MTSILRFHMEKENADIEIQQDDAELPPEEQAKRRCWGCGREHRADCDEDSDRFVEDSDIDSEA